MATKKKVAFDLFRYQIQPKDRYYEPELFEEFKTIDNLIDRKNELFIKYLYEVVEFKTTKSPIIHKVLYQDKNCVLYRFAAIRSLKVETKNFTQEDLLNYPSVLVFVFNDPEIQIIAVQERMEAFQKTEAVARAVIGAVEKKMAGSNLHIQLTTLFHEGYFWDLINEHKGKITNIRFELITPNMSNISSTIRDELKSFAKNTNSAQTNLEIISDPDSSVQIVQEDKMVQSLVQYSSDGGGNISVKVRGLNKRIQTKKSIKNITIDELDIESREPETIVSIIKGLL